MAVKDLAGHHIQSPAFEDTVIYSAPQKFTILNLKWDFFYPTASIASVSQLQASVFSM